MFFRLQNLETSGKVQAREQEHVGHCPGNVHVSVFHTGIAGRSCSG